MVSVIVKGDKFQAARAAADRGIPFVFRQEDRFVGAVYTAGRVPVTHLDLVVGWFAESDNAPYRVGACLHYAKVLA